MENKFFLYPPKEVYCRCGDEICAIAVKQDETEAFVYPCGCGLTAEQMVKAINSDT